MRCLEHWTEVVVDISVWSRPLRVHALVSRFVMVRGHPRAAYLLVPTLRLNSTDAWCCVMMPQLIMERRAPAAFSGLRLACGRENEVLGALSASQGALLFCVRGQPWRT